MHTFNGLQIKTQETVDIKRSGRETGYRCTTHPYFSLYSCQTVQFDLENAFNASVYTLRKQTEHSNRPEEIKNYVQKKYEIYVIPI